MTELSSAYETLRQAGTSHADTIDLLIRRYHLDRLTIRAALTRAGVQLDAEALSPPSRAAYLQARPVKAKTRRRRNKGGRRRGPGRRWDEIDSEW